VIYENDGRIRLGLDHWGYGGPVSEPFAISHGRPHLLEVTLQGLYPPARHWGAPAAAGRPAAPFALVLDGRGVLAETLPYHPAAPGEVYPGRNPVGSSVAAPAFSGRILARERFNRGGAAPPR
jgi:hypothetical protein